uniref:Si:ch1073-513e17.1 n=1 Tax=Oncorhynchus kisutch TaxID=8019 RepID=A0A8C7G8M5_ONCKI
MALQNGYSIDSSPLDEIPPQCCSARCNLAIMMFFGFSVVYGLRVNLSVAMVAMVNGTKSQPSLNSSGGHECPVSSHGNGSQTPDQPDGVSTSSSKVSTRLIVVYSTLEARWAPPLERSRLMTLSGSGANFGAFVALPLTGFIRHSLGWPAVFYMFGGAGCIWAVFWFILVSDQPGTHPRISTREKDYIINSIGKGGGAHGWSVPLLPMMLSVPLWAIIVSQMCANWGNCILLTSLPTYMDTVLHFDLRQNAFLSALPYLGGWAFSVISGVVADSLLEKELLSVTAVRKIFTITGLLLPAAFLVAVGYSGCSGVLAVTFLTLSSTAGGTSAAGVFINQIDIAPRYAGVLFGITNTFGTIPGVVAPIITGYLTKDQSLAGWRSVFCLSAGISAVEAFIFTLFGSGEVQKWALVEVDQEQAETKRDRFIPIHDR